MNYYFNLIKQIEKMLNDETFFPKSFHNPQTFTTYTFKVITKEQEETPPEILEIDSKIKEKRIQLSELVRDMKFEDCIVVREELQALEEEKEALKQKNAELKEENKSAFDNLSELNRVLQAAIQSEDYEKAARIRDKIKELKDNL